MGVTGMRDREAKDLLEVIRSRARLVRELYLDLQVSSALCFLCKLSYEGITFNINF